MLNGVRVGALSPASLAFALYRSLALGIVMASAVPLNLLVAACLSASSVPLLLRRLGRDPAQGASVLLTFTTDSTGFFIFLGLAGVCSCARGSGSQPVRWAPAVPARTGE